MSKPPPVPPANRSPKGTGADPEPVSSDMPEQPERENLEEQGRSANTQQNTTVRGNHGKRQR